MGWKEIGTNEQWTKINCWEKEASTNTRMVMETRTWLEVSTQMGLNGEKDGTFKRTRTE